MTAEHPGGMPAGEKVMWVCLQSLVFLVPIALSNLTFLGIGGTLPLTFDQFDLPKVFLVHLFSVVGLCALVVGFALQ